MWYAIWTAIGSERKLCSWIREYVPDNLFEDCFVPLIEQNMRIKGEWKIILKPLFPGYLFVKTVEDNIGTFAEKIRKSELFAVILSTDGDFTPVNNDELYIIENAYNNRGVLGSSIGLIVGDKINILSGPLLGMEGAIKQINRHKRTATIELDMFGRISRITIGLEIISKT